MSQVNANEWQAIQADLRRGCDRFLELARSSSWSNEWETAGAIGVVAHTAYHLGEIRQALYMLKR